MIDLLPDSSHALGRELGDFLLANKKIDSVYLAYAIQKQKVLGISLWRIIIEERMLSERDVVLILSSLQGIEYVEIDDLVPVEHQVLSLFSREMCIAGNFLPLRRTENHIEVLLGDADPVVTAQSVLRRTGHKCKFLQGQFSQVIMHIRYAYQFVKLLPEQIVKSEVDKFSADVNQSQSPEVLLNTILQWAVSERSTDIHISQSNKTLHVLFRIDGVLQPMFALPASLVRILGYIKLVSEMDISEHRRPQDGSFRVSVLEMMVTIRVSSIITEFGERFVLRILPESQEVEDLSSLGFFPEDVEAISQAMSRPFGLILITGPTGSGKSSTLHAGLRMQHLIERNVLTVEDPLEYRVPAAAQTEVNRRAGYDFSNALRHFLRHDPDVILVGEMRDAETAQAALHASATGHLVLSTLHVTSAFGVMHRLTPFGLTPQSIAENLKLVINQRLVRRLCNHCAQDMRFSDAECAWLSVDRGCNGKVAVGCNRCRNTGYHGRMPVYEMLIVEGRIASAMASDCSLEDLEHEAHAVGFRSIIESAKRRIVMGETSFSEVRRVLGVGP